MGNDYGKCRINLGNNLSENPSVKFYYLFLSTSERYKNKICFAYYGYYNEFRNFHCFINSSPFYPPPPQPPPLSWSLISNLNDISNQPMKPCSDATFEDIITGNCKTIFCNFGFSPLGSGCVKSKELILNGSVNVNITDGLLKCMLMRKVNLYVQLKSDRKRFNITKLFPTKMDMHVRISKLSTDIYMLDTDTVYFTTLLDHLESKLNNYSWAGINKFVVTTNLKENFITKGLPFDPVLAFTNNKLCAKPHLVKPPYNISDECDIQKYNKSINYIEYNSFISIYKHGKEHHTYTCENFYYHSACPLVMLTNFFIDNNSNLHSPDIKQTPLHVSQYIPYHSNVAICASQFKTKVWKWLNIIRTIEQYVTIIGIPISILCIITLLVKFTRDGEMFYLPRLDICALCVSLLLSDFNFLLIFIMTNYFSINPNLCFALAVTLHWLLLSLHILAFIIGYEFAKAFLPKLGGGQKNIKVLFFKHCLVSFTFPLMVILVNITLHKTGVINKSYDDQLCWISNFKVRLFSYNLPSIILCVLSAGCVILGAVSIYTVHRQNSSAMHKHDKNRFSSWKIALKMAVLLGAIEIIGSIQITKDDLSEEEKIFNAVNMFVYAVLRSCKGISIAMLYYVKGNRAKDKGISVLTTTKDEQIEDVKVITA